MAYYSDLFNLDAVTTIFKSGNNFNVTNYRLISLSSHIVNLFVSLVLRSIIPDINSILIDERHGSRPDRSLTSKSIVFIITYLTLSLTEHK